MAGTPVGGSVVLLSVKPQYAAAIMNGSKGVEFRKRRFASPPARVLVYASSPVQAIVGYFDVAGVCEDKPERLWERFAELSAVNREAFRDYYRSVSLGTAILVGRRVRLRRPLSLADIGRERAPQSFVYLPVSSLDRLRVSGATLAASDE